MQLNTLLAAQDDSNALVIGIVLVVGVMLLIVLGVFARFFNLWVQCKFTGVGISMGKLIMMSIRKVNPSMMVRCKIMAVQAGLPDISTQALEAHFLSGGNVPNVIRALVAAHRAGIDMEWKDAQAIDLAGRDVLDAVRTSVNPRVIECPDGRQSNATLDAVAGDGIQLKARARVTVRTNIKQLIGGATEETIIARVGQGIVRAIGSTSSYKDVLSNPELISQTVLNEGLEAQTSFEIVSIDIADIDVGENIGARLQADRAEADVRIYQAHAEERRAAAAAREQEMVALTQENRAQVVLAEATVPMSIASAFRSGRLGLMDYYELKNVQADTKMRSTIAGIKDDSMA